MSASPYRPIQKGYILSINKKYKLHKLKSGISAAYFSTIIMCILIGLAPRIKELKEI